MSEKQKIEPVRLLDPTDPRHIDHPSHKEQWLELARALGRLEADRDFRRIQEWQRQNEDGPLPDTTACASCGSQEPATQLMRLWTGEKIVRQYWHSKCFEEATDAALNSLALLQPRRFEERSPPLWRRFHLYDAQRGSCSARDRPTPANYAGDWRYGWFVEGLLLESMLSSVIFPLPSGSALTSLWLPFTLPS